MTNQHLRRRISVSTWSLHRSLGRPPFYGPEATGSQSATPTISPAFSLLELPARIAAAGIHTLEICHFHLPSRESDYLTQLRAALEAAEVELWSLLIDSGDITHPGYAERDMAWIEGWFEVAGQLGAKTVRVIAGKSEPSEAALARSAANFARLIPSAQRHGVRVITENWLNLLTTPELVLSLLDRLEGEVGLCADFGNWKGPQKYSDLAQIFPRADSCHTKAHFSAPGQMDRKDYIHCLDLTYAAGFAGPYTLIYDGPDNDEFAGLRQEHDVVALYL